MAAHPYFPELILRGDSELATALGSDVVARAELQAWPLAVTESIRLADGRRFVCKTQLPPTVEPQFYAAARSDILPDVVDLGPTAGGHTLLIAWLDHPRLDPHGMSAEHYVGLARQVVDAIASIEGDVPVHLDLSTPDRLQAAVQQTSDRLRGLVASDRFTRISTDQVSTLDRWGASPATMTAATCEPTISHADLGPAEVFLTGSDAAFRIIDWQRPVRGPRDLDLVSLLRAAEMEPLDHLDRSIVELEAFVRLHWAALCATDVLPDLPAHFYETWATDALAAISVAPS